MSYMEMTRELTTCTHCDSPVEFFLVAERTHPTWCLDCSDAELSNDGHAVAAR
jgi:hypothetical protein